MTGGLVKNKEFIKEQSEIAAALNRVGLRAGDVVMIHSDLGVCWPEGAQTREQALEGHYRAIMSVLGNHGTLVAPAFHYDFTRGVDYDLSLTKSQGIGHFGDYVVSLSEARRSTHPIFNFACAGALAEKLTAPLDLDAFGPDSFFQRVFCEGGKILFYGAAFQSCTFVHHVEQMYGVPYRYVKPFWGRIVLPDRELYNHFNYFVRPLDEAYSLELSRFEKHLLDRGLMEQVPFGLKKLSLVAMSDFMIEAFRLLPESPDLFLNEPPVRYWTFRKGRELIQLKPIVNKLHSLNRTIVSDDYDKSLNYLAEVLGPFGAVKTHSIPSGSTAWSWEIPSRWRLHEAYIEHDGRRILDLRDNILHVVAGSLPIDEEIDLEELRTHLHTLPDRPRVVPYEFKYYELDWGFCMTHEQACSLSEGRYRVFIRSEYIRDNLNVGEFTLKGAQDKGILITTHLDHPAQANDGLSSCTVAVGLIQRLAGRDLKHTYRIIFQPENIGTTAYLFANQQLVPHFEFGIVMEMLGTRGNLALQYSYPGGSRIDRIAEHVLNSASSGFHTGEYGRIIGNDERVTNMPGIGIPTISISRWPYREYHGSDDNPSIIHEEPLQEAADIMESIIDIYDRDYIPTITYHGSIHLSRFGMWVDWRINPRLNKALDDIMVRLDGQQSVFEIAHSLGLPFDQVYGFLEKAVENGLVEKKII